MAKLLNDNNIMVTTTLSIHVEFAPIKIISLTAINYSGPQTNYLLMSTHHG